jgi:RNA polymerase sigma-70 factor, ECF subfamily
MHKLPFICHKVGAGGVMDSVARPNDVVSAMSAGVKTLDIETLFRMHYARVARMIVRVVRNQGRAEELAVEVFLKLWRRGTRDIDRVEGWLYRVAAHAALDELRRQTRRARYESLLGWMNARRAPATPEEVHRSSQQQDRVRAVLSALPARQAQFLVLRTDGFSYTELAVAMGVNPGSVGTTLIRAQHAFRKEYIKRYGEQ